MTARLRNFAGSMMLAAVVLGNIATSSHAATPLDPTTIPKYTTALPIPPVYAPTVVKNSSGAVVSHDYTVSVEQFAQ